MASGSQVLCLSSPAVSGHLRSGEAGADGVVERPLNISPT
jgi:hypothetical protein